MKNKSIAILGRGNEAGRLKIKIVPTTRLVVCTFHYLGIITSRPLRRDDKFMGLR